MSSATGSRDSQSSGTAPKVVPLGYSARVLYTFLPHEREQTEIFVSEGDIVRLEYQVGSWVYVTSVEGDSGYIPAEFCAYLTGENSYLTNVNNTSSPNTAELLSSNGNHATITDTSLGASGTSEDRPDAYSAEDKVSSELSTGITEFGEDVYTKLNKVPQEIYIPRGFDKRSSVASKTSTLPKSDSRFTNKDTTTNVKTCDICGGFITSLPPQIKILLKSNKGKVDLQSRKLLSVTGAHSIQGLHSCESAIETNGKGISQFKSAERHEPAKYILKELRTNCTQCNALKSYLQRVSSMSTVYTNIRDLQLDAVSDSDSEGNNNVKKDDVVVSESLKGADVLMENGHERKYGEKSDESESDGCDTPPPPLPSSSPPPLIDLVIRNDFGDITDVEKQEKIEQGVVNGKQTTTINRAPGTRTLPAVPKNDSKMAWNDKPLLVPLHVFDANQTFFDPLLQPDMGNPDEDFMRHGSRTTNGFASSEGSVESSEPDKFLGVDGRLYDSESELCIKRVSVSSYESSEEGARPLSGLSELASPSPKSPDMKGIDLLGGFTDSSINDQNMLVPSKTFTTDKSITRTLPKSSSVGVDSISATNRNLKSANDAVQNSIEYDRDRNSSGAKSENSHGSKMLPPTPKPFDFRNKLMVLGNRPKIQTLPNRILVAPAIRTRQHTTTAMVSSVNTNRRDEEPRTKIRPSIITIAPPVGDKMRVNRRQQPLPPSRTNADRQDEKEIKKTLHEHSMCPRRASQMPMRAHHSIHAEAAGKDPRIMRPTGRTILVKKHNKQMWRPPTVSPEGGETQRPFSPFGGTLPPSKICSKKKVVEVFV